MAKLALTDRKVQSLKAAPKGKRIQVMDSLVPGFGVRVTDKGVKTYIFQARFPGSVNPARREINKATLEQARDTAREWSALIKQGVDPAQVEEEAKEEQARVRANTFGSIMNDYFERKLAKQRSGKSIRSRIENNLLPIFKERPISEITDLDILGKVVNPRAIKTPSMARSLFNDLGGFFSWVVDQRVYGLKASPCATIKISKIVGKINKRKRILNDDELRALWIAANRLPYPVGPLYRGLVLSALRIRELSNTDRREWHLHGNAWKWEIPAERMKGKEAHVVPVTADIREIYDACPKRGRFLFSYNGGDKPMSIANKVSKDLIDAEMLKVLREIAVERGDNPEEVELAHWVNHDIRRTVRSKLSRIKGLDLETREAVLAHVKPGMQGVYDQYEYFDEKREALELWAARLRQIVDPPAGNVVPIRREATA
ncbi:MAG: integrase family protein [Bradyrhizobium sp.]